MMNFKPIPSPPTFEQKCRKRGLAWLARKRTAKRPPDYWSLFRGDLQDGFRRLCAYSCMDIDGGTVDHYLSWKTHPKRAYNWDNYRFAAQWINSSKGTLDDAVLDPFKVKDGWFEILLPSLQLVVTDAVPKQYRAKAEFTLKRLHLRDDERVIRQRREWYRMYQDKELTLEGLHKKAPLIARAVEKEQERKKQAKQKLLETQKKLGRMQKAQQRKKKQRSRRRSSE